MRIEQTMKLGIASVFIALLFMRCSLVSENNKGDTGQLAWEELVDANLSQWDRYLSYQHQLGYNGSHPLDENGGLLAPIGLNKPGYKVFSTTMQDGQHIIRVSGEYYGCLTTKKSYENYHFQLKYKWGDKKWANRKDKLMDSGILYHSIGPFGAEFWRTWMLSQEFQIMEGHTGDYWSQASSAIDIRAYKPESNLNPMAHASQDYLPISMDSPYKNYCLRSSNHEKPHGEWNTLDLYCFEDKSLHLVNGQVVMVLKRSRYTDENKKTIPLTKGRIQLQSEGAEVFFKDVRIRKIDAFSKAYQSLF